MAAASAAVAAAPLRKPLRTGRRADEGRDSHVLRRQGRHAALNATVGSEGEKKTLLDALTAKFGEGKFTRT